MNTNDNQEIETVVDPAIIDAKFDSLFNLDFDYSYNIKSRICAATILNHFEHEIKSLWTHCPDVQISCWGTELEITCATRQDTVLALQAFGGRWEKSLDYNKQLYYTQHFQVRLAQRVYGDSAKARVKIAGQLPPSCKVVEKEVPLETPIYTRKVREVVCSQGNSADEDVSDNVQIVEPKE